MPGQVRAQMLGIAECEWIALSLQLLNVLPFGLDGGVAAYILQADRWEAGAALMQTGNPQAWHRA